MPLAGREFEVVLARLDASPQDLRALEACLSAAELKRADRFFFERDRRRFVVARARLRQLLGERLGMAPQDIRLAYGANGKPRLADEAREVGVDIEAVRPIDSADAIAAHILSQRERRAYAAARDKVAAFLRFWTRKEALAKAIGAGFSIAPEKLEPARAPGWHVRSFCPLPGFIAAIACHTDR
jgi:4'-phosphopantetheinyl transferase